MLREYSRTRRRYLFDMLDIICIRFECQNRKGSMTEYS